MVKVVLVAPLYERRMTPVADRRYSSSRSLEIHLHGSIKGKLKGLILALTHWVATSPNAA